MGHEKSNRLRGSIALALTGAALLVCGLAVAVNLLLIGLWALGRIGPLAQ